MSSFDIFNGMNILNVIFLLYILSMKSESFTKISTFWHISDVYWATKDRNCSEQIATCVNISFNTLAEKSGHLHPDFVLWSSAGGPYLKSVIRQMKKVIKNIIVLPSLAPINLPADSKYVLYYQNLSDYFGDWLDEQACHTFWKAGYYTQILEIPEKLQIVVLNTALFCKFHVASELDDPGNQWTWLSLELTKARLAKRKVYLLLSAAPGIAGNFSDRMFTSKHNDRYIKMVQTYADVIKGQFGGYEEGNKFHIFYDKNDRGCGWLMLAPPFYNSARLYLYETKSLELFDYVQFYKQNHVWHVQYRFTFYYAVPNISVFSLELLLTKMQDDVEIFDKYASAIKQSLDPNDTIRCENDTCTKTHMCRIVAVDYNDFAECISQDPRAHFSERKINEATCLTKSGLFVIKYFLSVLFVNKFYFEYIGVLI